jgi:hypothetical protein
MNYPAKEWREELRALMQMEEMPVLEDFIQNLLTTYANARVRELVDSLRVDADDNDVTDHFIADDVYESKVEAFFYGYEQALDEIIKSITPYESEVQWRERNQ